MIDDNVINIFWWKYYKASEKKPTLSQDELIRKALEKQAAKQRQNSSLTPTKTP